jgi:hypothetical protein
MYVKYLKMLSLLFTEAKKQMLDGLDSNIGESTNPTDVPKLIVYASSKRCIGRNPEILLISTLSSLIYVW